MGISSTGRRRTCTKGQATMAVQASTREYWWVYAIAGIVSILFGFAAIFWPGITLGILILLYGAFAIVDGIARLIGMFRAMGAHQTWWPQLVLGLLGIAVGLFVLFNPGISAVLLVYVIAFWALAIGVMEIVASLTTGQFVLIITGILSIVFGLILLGNPVAGVLALIVVIGIFSIIRGVILLVEAIRATTVPTPTA